MTTAKLSMVTIHVTNLDRAIAYYRDVLGLALTEHIAPVKWAEFDLGGVKLGIHEDATEHGHRAPGGSTGFYVTVANVDDHLAKAERRGARIGDKPADFPYGRVGSLLDPDGNEIMFLQPS